MYNNPTTRDFKPAKRFTCSVKDAVKPLKITVGTLDIRGAECMSRSNCVIARALKRQGKGRGAAPWVDVGAHIVLVRSGTNKAVRYVLSKIGKEQVRFFDSSKNKTSFAPCIVELMPPPPSIALGVRRGANARSGKKTSSKPVRHRNPPTR